MIFSWTLGIIAIAHWGHQGAEQTRVVHLGGGWGVGGKQAGATAEGCELRSPAEAEVLTSVHPGDGV